MQLSITGMGVVSPAGVGKEEFYASLTKGRTGIDYYESNPFVRKAGVVKDFSVRNYTKNFKQARPLAKVSHFAIAASKMAAEDGLFSLRGTDHYRTGIITGTNEQFDDSSTLPIIRAYEKSLDENGKVDPVTFADKGLRELPAKYILQVTPNITTFACSYELSLNGYSSTVISGSNASFETLVEADVARSRGMAESFFCGATDCMLSPIDSISLIPPGATTVADCTAVPGEGSVFFLIDDSTRVDVKKSKIYAEIASCTGLLLHQYEDIGKNIDSALHRANLSADDIDAIVVSEGAGSVISRPVIESIGTSFSKITGAIPISSPTPYVGYTRAAAGAFGLAFGVFILETGRIPLMLQAVDTSFCKPFLCEEKTSIEGDFRTVLIVNIGLTGCVYCAVLRKPDR